MGGLKGYTHIFLNKYCVRNMSKSCAPLSSGLQRSEHRANDGRLAALFSPRPPACTGRVVTTRARPASVSDGRHACISCKVGVNCYGIEGNGPAADIGQLLGVE